MLQSLHTLRATERSCSSYSSSASSMTASPSLSTIQGMRSRFHGLVSSSFKRGMSQQQVSTVSECKVVLYFVFFPNLFLPPSNKSQFGKAATFRVKGKKTSLLADVAKKPKFLDSFSPPSPQSNQTKPKPPQKPKVCEENKQLQERLITCKHSFCDFSYFSTATSF